MSETTKKTTTKTAKKASAPNTSSKKIVEETVLVAPTHRKYEASDVIECTSCTAGTLIMIGKKTGNKYIWTDYGDVSEIEYQDLQSARLTRSDYIYKPYFIINDEELISQWNDVDTLYQNVLTRAEILELFDLPSSELEKTLERMPSGMKDSVKKMASDRIMHGTLDRLNVIKTIDKVLGTDLFSLVV